MGGQLQPLLIDEVSNIYVERESRLDVPGVNTRRRPRPRRAGDRNTGDEAARGPWRLRTWSTFRRDTAFEDPRRTDMVRSPSTLGATGTSTAASNRSALIVGAPMVGSQTAPPGDPLAANCSTAWTPTVGLPATIGDLRLAAGAPDRQTAPPRSQRSGPSPCRAGAGRKPPWSGTWSRSSPVISRIPGSTGRISSSSNSTSRPVRKRDPERPSAQRVRTAIVGLRPVRTSCTRRAGSTYWDASPTTVGCATRRLGRRIR